MMPAPDQRSLWPLRPQPRDHERIDLWVRRLAKAYGLTTATFYRYALGLPRAGLQLLRTNPPEEVLARLEAGTGVSIAKLRTMTDGAMKDEYRRFLAESFSKTHTRSRFHGHQDRN